MILDNGSKISTNTNSMVSNLAVIKLTADIISITDSRIELITRMTKLENGKETLITGQENLNLYKWMYTISTVANKNKKQSPTSFKVTSSDAKLSIAGLSANNSYVLTVHAIDLATTNEYNSSSIIFTTSAKDAKNSTKQKLYSTLALYKVPKVYIKVKDIFKRAIFYINN